MGKGKDGQRRKVRSAKRRAEVEASRQASELRRHEKEVALMEQEKVERNDRTVSRAAAENQRPRRTEG